jgi:predicted NAD-dependent protein-ADP-ribosyltransferase YbiA (DUF1768 family)
MPKSPTTPTTPQSPKSPKSPRPYDVVAFTPQRAPQSLLQFGSGSKVRHFSNFFAAPITATAADVPPDMLAQWPRLADWLAVPRDFTCTEALWQALKARTLDTFLAFTSTGRFGRLPAPGAADIFPDKTNASLLAYWGPRSCEGVVPKMAVLPARAHRLGLDLDHLCERLETDLEVQVWQWILLLKYRQNGSLRQRLLQTAPKFLLEHCRVAKSQFVRHGTVEHWGGVVDDTGDLYGENFMGACMMRVRDVLQAERSDRQEKLQDAIIRQDIFGDDATVVPALPDVDIVDDDPSLKEALDDEDVGHDVTAESAEWQKTPHVTG